MTSYNEKTAIHYRSYRPPLHDLILAKCLGYQRFKRALDVGCGIGHSSIALQKYCDWIEAIDPSEDMINRSLPASNIHYSWMSAGKFLFPNGTFDLITFAGSLYYAKSQHLLEELNRLGNGNATIITYDFEVNLSPILSQIPAVFSFPAYNHQCDFAGLENPYFEKINAKKERVSFETSSENIAHLILSVPEAQEVISKLYANNPFDELTLTIKKKIQSDLHNTDADIFYTTYIQKPGR